MSTIPAPSGQTTATLTLDGEDLAAELESAVADTGILALPLAGLPAGTTITIAIMIGPAPEPAPEPALSPAGPRFLGGRR